MCDSNINENEKHSKKQNKQTNKAKQNKKTKKTKQKKNVEQTPHRCQRTSRENRVETGYKHLTSTCIGVIA